MMVKDVMTKNVHTISTNDRLSKAVDIISRQNVSGCPIVDRQRRVKGFISETDILKLIDVHADIKNDGLLSLVLSAIKSETMDSMKKSIKDFLNSKAISYAKKKAVTINANGDPYEAMMLMNKHNINRVLVVDDEGRLKGILSRRDLIRAIARM